MTFLQLLQAINEHEGSVPLDAPVRLIIGGTAHPVDDVWFMPHAEETGALCVGEDPR